jgi:hypothetical protein
MNSKTREIEARLHRSLVNQVHVPKLDHRFDAGVWARIEAQEQAQTLGVQPVSHKSGSERWLLTSNIGGIAVAVVLVVYFGWRTFGGADVEVSLPNFSGPEGGQAANLITWAVTIAALGCGALFTPLGRWLRAEFT